MYNRDCDVVHCTMMFVFLVVCYIVLIFATFFTCLLCLDSAEGVGESATAAREGEMSSLPGGRAYTHRHHSNQPLPVSAILRHAVQGENTQHVSIQTCAIIHQNTTCTYTKLCYDTPICNMN